MRITEAILNRIIGLAWCQIAGHDFFNGGEHCRDCHKECNLTTHPHGCGCYAKE